MILLKITTEKKEGDVFSRIQIGVPKIEMIDYETGESTDVSASVRSCVVEITPDDIVTAKLEMVVAEMDIDGAKVVG